MIYGQQVLSSRGGVETRPCKAMPGFSGGKATAPVSRDFSLRVRASTKLKRHSWADPVRFQFKTERTCKRCDVTKVTRHEIGVLPWIEFYRGLEKIECTSTPACEGVV